MLRRVTGLVTSSQTDGVVTVTLRRPEKRNAMNQALIAELAETFTRWRGNDTVSVVVLTGEGSKAFASGGDLVELGAVRSDADALAFSTTTRAAFDTIRRFPVPVIAGLNGDALGGGAELAVACDVRFAARHARIGFLQGSLNISTAWGGGTDLFQLVGPARALLLLSTAEMLDVERALGLGLIDATAPADEPFSDALARFTARFAKRPPHVARAFKALAIAHRTNAPPAEMEAVETRAFTQTWVHPAHWDAVETVFTQRRREG